MVQPRGYARVNRFTVMAVLQAARAQELGLTTTSAYSWGLNRAIFYAAAKKGFIGEGGARSSTGKSAADKKNEKEVEKNEFYLGTEKAYADKKASSRDAPYFSIGDSVQTPADFERQIISRFGNRANFERAWKEATDIVKQYDKNTLESQQEFYEKVYKPRRDALSEEWTERFAPKKKIAAAKSM